MWINCGLHNYKTPVESPGISVALDNIKARHNGFWNECGHWNKRQPIKWAMKIVGNGAQSNQKRTPKNGNWSYLKPISRGEGGMLRMEWKHTLWCWMLCVCMSTQAEANTTPLVTNTDTHTRHSSSTFPLPSYAPGRTNRGNSIVVSLNTWPTHS